MIRLILLFSLLFFYSHTEANDGSENDLFEILKDFKLKDGEDYNRQVSSFYLDDASKNKGYKLKIDSKGSFSLFINDNIQYMGNSMTINIDSLFKAVSLPIISFSLYGKKEIKFELVQNPVKNGLSEKPAKLSDT
ncbi:MAG: hypothetical protein OEY34_01865, partial [Cyclobacteriaceae bacterium]|nr:hypothetical protein [Cyclobacteriaceae bacterium]